MEEVLKQVEEKIKEILKEGINQNNAGYLYRLVDIHKDIKEEEKMNYEIRKN